MKRILLIISALFTLLPAIAGRPKVGLVLGGGGAKGAAEVGVLKVIEREGIPIDYIAGTSIGSIIGGLYSEGYRADDLDKLFRSQHWLNLLTGRDSTRRGKVYSEDDGVTYLFGFPVKRERKKGRKHKLGLLRGDAIYDFLDSLNRHSPVKKNPSLQKIPFVCVAYDVEQHREVELDTGNLALNMRASMAIPGGFKPVQMDSMTLVDGGVINNLPVDVVKRMGADIIIAIDLTQNKHDDYQSPFKFLEGLGGMFDWLANRPDIQKYNENRRSADVYVNPDLKGYGVTSFKPAAIEDMINIGEDTGRLCQAEFSQVKTMLNAATAPKDKGSR